MKPPLGASAVLIATLAAWPAGARRDDIVDGTSLLTNNQLYGGFADW